MNKEEREKYQKKIKLHEKLGALKFQKLVFKVEKLKFKALKKLFPNFIYRYDKFCDRNRDKEIKKAKTKEEVEAINRKYKVYKMEMRKEFNQEKNRNYHIDKNNPTQIFNYLEWNKDVHKRGLIKNAIIFPILTGLVITGNTILIPLLVYEGISAFINFECINIQDYNLCRCKMMEDYIKKREERRREANIENFGEASKVIYKSIEENENIPTFEEILKNVKNKEQLKQIRELLLQEKREREIERGKVKIK